MTFSHFSKDLIRPPVSGGQFAGAVRGLVFFFTFIHQRSSLCVKKQNAIIFISRKGRKGRRTSNANYAIAEVVAGYARQSAQRQRKTENGERKSV